jgi:hypothetical protein
MTDATVSTPVRSISREEAARLAERCAQVLIEQFGVVERIFERIAVRLDGGLPSGALWHTQLLDRMAAPVEGGRPAVIDPSLHTVLAEFLKFRHRIRHTYSYDLEWPRVKERADELGAVMRQLRAALEVFESKLEPPKG